MRRILAGMLLSLVLAGSAQGAGKPWDFVVGSPTAVQPLSPGAKPRSAALVKAFVDMPEGRQWASVLFCCYSIGRDVIDWKGGRAEIETSELAHEFDDVLGTAGFSEGARTRLFADSEAELQVGAVVGNLAGRLCSGCGLTTPDDHFKGAIYMMVEWQIYSPLERKVLLTVKTAGTYEVGDSLPGIGHIMNGAFRENVRQLLNSPGFRTLMTASPGSQAVAPAQSPLAPLQLLTIPAKARPIADSMKSVVAVFANSGMGSGFLVSQDGYVLSNEHVVGGAKFVKLKWADGTESLGEVVRTDSRRDVALIKATGRPGTPLALRPAPAQLGETVYAIGTPLDVQFQNTLTKGIVSANRVMDGQSFIQSDAAITHGNSGGPLLDEKGHVIGIAVSVVEPNGANTNLNFFIPIADALKALALAPAI